MAFAARCAYNLRLTHLLRVVVMIAQNMMSYAHVEKFTQNIYNLFISAKPFVHNMSLSVTKLENMFDAVQERMDLSKESSKRVACIFSKSDAKHVFNSLDTDGDKAINDHEFMTWVMRGASLSYAERKLFIGENDVNMRIVNFLEVVCVLCSGADLLDGMMLASQTASAHADMLEHGLKNLFSHFDADNSGEIDRTELERLMIDLPTRFYVSPESVCLPEDVDLVMKTLDEDGGGTVDFEEWKQWIVKGAKKSRSARNKFSRKSPAHKRLDLFMDTIIHISHEISAPLCEEGHELRPGLLALFQEFDRNHDAHLEAKDLLLMVEKLSHAHSELQWFDCNEKTSHELTIAIGGETQKISTDRWIEWMIRGARRPALERAKFASHSGQFKIINTFLESVLTVVRKSNLLVESSCSQVKGYERSSGRHTSGYGRLSKRAAPSTPPASASSADSGENTLSRSV
jgi:Ca2+-binding EF-hand superfamily protein